MINKDILELLLDIRKTMLNTNGKTEKDRNNIVRIFELCDRMIDKECNN
jgi:hypothetical protein